MDQLLNSFEFSFLLIGAWQWNDFRLCVCPGSGACCAQWGGYFGRKSRRQDVFVLIHEKLRFSGPSRTRHLSVKIPVAEKFLSDSVDDPGMERIRHASLATLGKTSSRLFHQPSGSASTSQPCASWYNFSCCRRLSVRGVDGSCCCFSDLAVNQLSREGFFFRVGTEGSDSGAEVQALHFGTGSSEASSTAGIF